MDILKGYLFGTGYAFLCLLFALLLYKLGVAKKVTRKVVHILVGFEWVILYHFFGAGLNFLAVCVFFLFVLWAAYKWKMMPMISSDNDNAPGTVYYAVAMTGVAIVGCFIPEVMLPFGVGIMCTSVGDGFAGVVGQCIKKKNPKIYGNKSLYGTLANFIASFGAAFVMNIVYDLGLSIWHAVAIAALSVTLELVTGRGLDNITITWGCTALTAGFMYFENINFYLVPILLSPWFIAVAYKKKALTFGGVVMAVVIDLFISVSLGNFGFTLLGSFFAIAVLVDKFKKRVKKQGRNEESAKGDCRDYMQVIANGMLAGLCALLYLGSRERVFILAFSAALAEALADTVSSGIGIAAKRTYDPFRWRVCESGISGGMSVLGTFSSLVAAYGMSMIAYAFGVVNFVEALIITAAAFLGGVFDSFLGSLLQAKYKCSVCGKITEKNLHCGERTERFRGLSFIDNDAVNMLSGIFAAVFASLVFLAV